MDRDEQLAVLIRREIDKIKDRARVAGWHPRETAWHRAYGEISGLHLALQFIDRNANDVLPPLPDASAPR